VGTYNVNKPLPTFSKRLSKFINSDYSKLVCSSTPWHSDSVFFKIFNHKDFSAFKTLYVPVEKATEQNGPLKTDIIQKIKTQMGDDPSRWRREMEAEWVEDDDV